MPMKIALGELWSTVGELQKPPVEHRNWESYIEKLKKHFACVTSSPWCDLILGEKGEQEKPSNSHYPCRYWQLSPQRTPAVFIDPEPSWQSYPEFILLNSFASPPLPRNAECPLEPESALTLYSHIHVLDPGSTTTQHMPMPWTSVPPLQ